MIGWYTFMPHLGYLQIADYKTVMQSHCIMWWMATLLLNT
jgi:hypothetical protein